MEANLRDILKTATFRQSLITFSGTAINGVLGAAFYILTARFLGPASFGLLSVAIATLTLVSDTANLGTDTGIVNFVGKYIRKDQNKAYRFLKLGLVVKIVAWIGVLIVGSILAPSIAENLFKKPELTNLLRISFLGVGGSLLFSYAASYLQSFQKFFYWSLLYVSTNALRLIIIFLLISLVLLNPESTLISYISVTFLGFLFTFIFIPIKILRVQRARSVAKEFFHYNKWVAAFGLIAAVGARLDTFISARLLTATELGIYSAANQLVQVVPQIIGALATVIAPKMASQGSLEKFVSYFKKTQILVLGVSVLLLLAIPVAFFIFPFLFGGLYSASFPIFIILLFAMLVFLISIPTHMAVFYYYSKPELFFWLSLGHLAVVALLGWNLIASLGATGAAITVLAGNTFNFLIPFIWVFRKIKYEKKT